MHFPTIPRHPAISFDWFSASFFDSCICIALHCLDDTNSIAVFSDSLQALLGRYKTAQNILFL